MRKTLVLLVLVLISSLSFAALSDYTFQQSPATYTELTESTVIHSTGIDDAMSAALDIGFTFVYDENSYTQFKANSNGFITLNTASSASLSNNLSAQTLIIAGIWDDLKTDDSDAGVSYYLSGTAPNRVLTVQYKNLKWYYSANPVNLANYQIKLYEGSNKIEIVYGTVGAAPGTSASASIGLSGAVLGNFLSITPASPTATYSSTTSFNSINATHVPFFTGTIYTFNPPVPMNNDLAATAIAGNTIPSVGTSYNYTVTVFNRGLVAQNNYSVKLVDAGNVELATVAGPAINPGQTLQVTVPWTPATEGPVAIRGKVVLAGDENPVNDHTSPMNISVQPAGITVVTIGTGDLQEGVPWEFYFKNSLYQTLIYQDEIGFFGNISSIQFFNNFATNLPGKPVKLWLGTTAMTDLSAGWVDPASLTLVYDGTIDFPSGVNTITVPLQTPFTYTGGTLVLYAHRPMDTDYFSSSDNFAAQTVGTNRARKLVSDSTTYDPMAPAAGTVSGTFPKMSLMMSPLSPDPIFSMNPANANFGQILMGATATRTVNITNVGGGTLGITNISLGGSPMYTISNMPTLPASLGLGQSLSLQVVYAPTAAGTHEATLSVTDNIGGGTVHTATLTGSAIDATIYTLPYSYGFDDVTPPALPLQWSKLIQSTATAVVQTYTTTPQSTPNTAGMTNSSDANATAILIAPPLSTEIPTNTVRVKFWGRSSSAGYLVSVGVMSNPTNASSYTEIQSIALTTTWTEYIVSLTGYTGTGKFISFKHGLGGTSRLIYIDTVSFEPVAPNDLGAVSINGNATPTVGMSSDYIVNVQNWGTSAQSTYTVKLYNSDNTELASVAGTAINPGQTIAVTVPWVPTTEGAQSIYGKVVLDNDVNPANDQTAPMNLLVNPAGLVTITVGDGSQSARIPFDLFYKNSLYQTLYYPAEMGNFMGQITGLRLYANIVSTDIPAALPFKVWMGTTTQADLSAAWIPSTELTLVFDGTLDFPAGEQTVMLPFSTPYLYLNGENLVVMFNRPMDTDYYSSSDQFKVQTVGTNRARNVYNDTTVLDPAAPTGGSTTGQFPKTTFTVIPGGVGDIMGTVTAAGGTLLEGVSVELVDAGYNTTTNAQGQYSLLNVLPANYTISFSKYGYVTYTQAITLAEDQELTVNATLQPMATVNVSGTVLASDTGTGINGASINISGYANYTGTTNAQGNFTIPGVYANQAYTYQISAVGYTSATGAINVAATNHAMGNITLAELAFAPGNVQAVLNVNAIDLSWTAPDPNSFELTEGFENTTFPPMNWTQSITNSGPVNASGVYPTWCRFGDVTIGTATVSPTEGTSQTGLWWAYEHQDEWLITPSFYCPSNTVLSFDSYVYLGSTAGDHYYVKASTDNGNTWDILWDASAQTGGWNYYASPITVDLSAYTGSDVKLAFHAVDPPSNDGLWYVWFIDDILITNGTDRISFTGNDLVTMSKRAGSGFASAPATQISRALQTGLVRSESSLPMPANETTSTRVLTGYKVWRLAAGQETSPENWILVTPEAITALNATDSTWATLVDGDYRWAVRAIYTSDVMSNPAFSNTMHKETVTGMISGVVRTQTNQPIPGATVTAGTFTATTNNSGAYTMIVPTGTYSVTASANLYQSQTVQNVVVNQDLTTTVNFNLTPGSDGTEDVVVAATALKGNYPNPFNPSTTISYSIKDAGPVRIDIYNLKGQIVRTLVNAQQASGNYNIVWNGKDDQGRSVGSGVYYYRMQTTSFTNTKKMLLVE